jgi:DNA-directed RNA polymerase specialized sigma24 family protein
MNSIDDKIKKYYPKLRSIIKNIIPMKNYSLIDDYVQDCVLFLFKKLEKDPEKDFNSSYLKSLAIKVCVDNIRSNSTNIKYHCSICNTFFNRKEKASNCCLKEKQNKFIEKNSYFGVAYSEVSLDYLNILSNKNNNYLINNQFNPEIFLNDKLCFDMIFSQLDDIEKEILLMLMEEKSIRQISKSVLMHIRDVKARIQYIKVVILRIYTKESTNVD